MSERQHNAKAEVHSQKDLLRIIKDAKARGDTELNLSERAGSHL